MAKRKRKLRDHPAMAWSVLGKTVESIEIGPPDDIVLVLDDGSRLFLSRASTSATFKPYEPFSPAPSESLAGQRSQ